MGLSLAETIIKLVGVIWHTVMMWSWRDQASFQLGAAAAAGFEESRNASDALLSHCGPLFREQQAQAPTTPALPERTTTTTHGVERTATRERKANVSVRSLPQSPTEHTPFPRGKGHCILCVGS